MKILNENIDIYDANMNFIQSSSRDFAHKNGLWHKSLHCWVVSKKKQSILVQQRNKNIDFPNLYDISVAGHILSGENIENSFREISEELNISYNKSKLYFLGINTEVIDFGQIKNREFQYVYFLKKNINLDKLIPNSSEVSGLFWLNIQDAISLFSKTKDAVITKGFKFNKDNKFKSFNFELSNDMFVPRNLNYYLTISIMAERLLKNKFPISI